MIDGLTNGHLFVLQGFLVVVGVVGVVFHLLFSELRAITSLEYMYSVQGDGKET